MILPLNTADDFSAVERLPSNDPPTQVWVSFQEKYEVLNRLLEEAFARLTPLDQCLMTAMMPGGVRIPARMLAADVFLVHTLEPERTRLLNEGLHLLTVEDSIVRHPLERGTNALRLAWHSPQANEAAWATFIETIKPLGIAARTEL